MKKFKLKTLGLLMLVTFPCFFVQAQTHNRIARINSNGTVDNTYNPSADGTVNAVAVQTLDTGVKLLIGGAFGNVNGIPHQRFARLNTGGDLDSSFYQLVKIPDEDDDSVVGFIFLQPDDGKVVVGGKFTRVKGTPTQQPPNPNPPDVTVKNLMRFLPGGQVDTTFCAGPTGPNGTVRALGLDANGLFIIGGDFTKYAVQGVAPEYDRFHIVRTSGY